ncbi:hypothetical protein TNCV_948391 [Trichonephila clavipes]|nr:hypothetical protein TNCV_948391 [Trichonephila clavipes]
MNSLVTMLMISAYACGWGQAKIRYDIGCREAYGDYTRPLPPCRNTSELTAQLQRLWPDLPHEATGDVTNLMPRRVSVCIAPRGGFTTY